MTALGSGLALSGLMHPVMALGICIGYLLLAGESFLATHALGVFRISFSIVGPTELRLVLAIGALKVVASPIVTLAIAGPVRLFDAGGAVAIAGMSAALLISAARNVRTLYGQETIPSARL